MNFCKQIKNLFQNDPGQKSKDLDWNEDHVWAPNLFYYYRRMKLIVNEALLIEKKI